MDPANVRADLPMLRLCEEATSVICGPQALSVPLVCAQRSDLISELREQVDCDASLPLALSQEEVEAWVECAEGYAAASDSEADPEDEDSDINDGEHDLLLLRALKAAEFLRDDKTVALIIDELGLAVMGKWTSVEDVPSEAERERARKIVDAVPPDTVVLVLKAILRSYAPPRRSASPHGGPLLECHPHCPLHTLQAAPRHDLHRLLQLLPRTFHTALVLAGCMLAGDEVGCMVSVHLHCDGAERAPQPDVFDDYRVKSERPPHACGPGCASPMFQLLAAAAPLDGGSLDRAWDPNTTSAVNKAHVRGDGATGSLPDGAAESDVASGSRCVHEPPAKRACTTQQLTIWGPQPRMHAQGSDDRAGPREWPWSARLPGACLTTVAVELPELPSWPSPASAAREPPRWCTALAELRTLRNLTLQVPNLQSLPVPECLSALRGLSALDRLSIIVQHGAFDDDYVYRCMYLCADDHAPVPMMSGVVLFSGVCGLTQLSVLDLRNLLVYPPNNPSPTVFVRSDVRQTVIAQLQGLTRLTSLKLRSFDLYEAHQLELLRTVQKMPSLKEVVCDVYHYWDTDYPPNQFIQLEFLRLCGAAQLTALQRLSLSGFCLRKENAVANLNSRMHAENSALLSRMTYAPLASAGIGEAQAPALAALLADLPVLEVLDLRENGLGDDGLQALTGALSRLTRLTRLDISANRATHVGVADVLAALLRAWPAGGARLRQLDIEASAIPPEHAGSVACLIRQFGRLEYVGLSRLGLGTDGVATMATALQSLPHLRVVHLYDNVCELQPVQPSVLAPLTRIHHLAYDFAT